MPRKSSVDNSQLPSARDISNALSQGSNRVDTANTVLVMQVEGRKKVSKFYVFSSDGPVHRSRHHPHSKPWNSVLRSKRSVPSVSAIIYFKNKLYVKTTFFRTFDEEKCSPIRLGRNDPFWKVSLATTQTPESPSCSNPSNVNVIISGKEDLYELCSKPFFAKLEVWPSDEVKKVKLKCSALKCRISSGSS